MSVYVDPLVTKMMKEPKARHAGRRFGHRWCHLFADTLEELHSMAAEIGVASEWFRAHSRFPHYDLSPGRRALALERGARNLPSTEILRQIALKLIAKQQAEIQAEKDKKAMEEAAKADAEAARPRCHHALKLGVDRCPECDR